MFNNSAPKQPVKLIFIHHSCGGNWLADDNGGLGKALMENNYFVSDTNYGWGPDKIGDNTYTGHWWSWFRGEKSPVYTNALYIENKKTVDYSRLTDMPDGENEIIMFKSCYPNSNLKDNPDDLIPQISDNLLKGEDFGEFHTVSNAKGIFIDLLEYFKTRQDKLFIMVTAPPVASPEFADNARALNEWLVYDWLKDYPYNNVAVFDFYNVLTSNIAGEGKHDGDCEGGNQHRYRNGKIQHVVNQKNNTSKYIKTEGDDHPSELGNQKATMGFIDLLNIYYNNWRNNTPK